MGAPVSPSTITREAVRSWRQPEKGSWSRGTPGLYHFEAALACPAMGAAPARSVPTKLSAGLFPNNAGRSHMAMWRHSATLAKRGELCQVRPVQLGAARCSSASGKRFGKCCARPASGERPASVRDAFPPLSPPPPRWAAGSATSRVAGCNNDVPDRFRPFPVTVGAAFGTAVALRLPPLCDALLAPLRDAWVAPWVAPFGGPAADFFGSLRANTDPAYRFDSALACPVTRPRAKSTGPVGCTLPSSTLIA